MAHPATEYPSVPLLHGSFVGDGTNDVITDWGEPIGTVALTEVRWEDGDLAPRQVCRWDGRARYAGIEMHGTGATLTETLRALEADYYAQTKRKSGTHRDAA